MITWLARLSNRRYLDRIHRRALATDWSKVRVSGTIYCSRPSFALPVVPGAKFTARLKADGEVKKFTTYVAHPEDIVYGYPTDGFGWAGYSADEVMAEFTEHRAIEE